MNTITQPSTRDSSILDNPIDKATGTTLTTETTNTTTVDDNTSEVTSSEHLPALVDDSGVSLAGDGGGDNMTSSPYDSNWDDDTPLPPRRPKTLTPFTWALVGVLIGGGGFALGTRVGWNTATPTAPASSRTGGNGTARTAAGATTATTVAGAAGVGANGTGAGAAGATNAAGGTGANRAAAGTGAGGGGGGGATIGQVQLVDGGNVYIQDNQGNVIKVTTGPSAVVTVTKPGTPADLKPGDNVAVQGTTDASGNIAATAINPVTAGRGVGNGGGGQGRTATTATATTPTTASNG